MEINICKTALGFLIAQATHQLSIMILNNKIHIAGSLSVLPSQIDDICKALITAKLDAGRSE